MPEPTPGYDKKHYHTAFRDCKIKVYPSNVDIEFDDGCITVIDVGVLYRMMAAHLYQNGIWSDMDWRKLTAQERTQFDIGAVSPQGDGGTYTSPGQVVGIRRTYEHDVISHVIGVHGVKVKRRGHQSPGR